MILEFSDENSEIEAAALDHEHFYTDIPKHLKAKVVE